MTNFTSIANAEDVAPGTMKQITFDGTELTIANVDGEYFAFAGRCRCIAHFAGHRSPAPGSSLAEGKLTEFTVTCPVHGTIYERSRRSAGQHIRSAKRQR